jgi:Adenylate and Guanylate cyclase catalytic domain
VYDEEEESDDNDDSSYSQGNDGEDDDYDHNNINNEGSYRSTGTSNSRDTTGTTSAHSDSESSHHQQLVMLPRTRIVVSGMILLAAIALGTATYLVTAKGQSETFTSKVRSAAVVAKRRHTQQHRLCRPHEIFGVHAVAHRPLLFAQRVQYYDYCALVLSSTSTETDRLMMNLQTFALSVTTYAVATGAVWPYVTVPNFELRGRMSNQVSKALSLTFSPLVESADLDSWGAYANSTSYWVDESRAVLALQPLVASSEESKGGDATARLLADPMVDFLSSTPSSSSIPDHVWTLDDRGNPRAVDARESVPYAPLWQQAPTPSNAALINYDLLSNPQLLALYRSMRAVQRPALSSVMDLRFLYSGAAGYAVPASTEVSTAADTSNVTSLMMSPLYPFVATKESFSDRNEISGLLLSVIDWERYLTKILPANVNGLVVVLTSTCGDVYTFQLNGPTVEYLGAGDLHETSYNSLLVTSDPFETGWLAKGNETPTGDNVAGGACSYVLRLYPSTTLEGIFTDQKPAVYTAVVVLLFFFTAMVFLLYDWLVTRRQNKVNASAKKTNAILSSLFPSTVRDRILQEAEEQAEQEEQLKNQAQQSPKRGGFALGNKALLRDFLKDAEADGAAGKPSSSEAGASKLSVSRPIADLFPETTVCFADLVGFTAWSSVREPTHVFQLLETIYHAFDKIAKKRSVFKVLEMNCCFLLRSSVQWSHRLHCYHPIRF